MMHTPDFSQCILCRPSPTWVSTFLFHRHKSLEESHAAKYLNIFLYLTIVIKVFFEFDEKVRAVSKNIPHCGMLHCHAMSKLCW